eukprot:TRINITY_DN42086_c0_g1_i1.p2 TRINITY_DN42086_c0_g1~~TRINITY_DN42086_c0_g1_i1.p2  ORF type:complete len:159 (+),score=12.91 TRINITY_DN42086_c0_g1_i1:34-510(+)
MIRRTPRSTLSSSSAASDVYKRQVSTQSTWVLKELGASKTLSHMIEGESLLNDGTALVLFEVLKEIVEGKSVTAGHVVWFFCRLSFGGPILGILFAIASSYWIGKLFRNELLEMVIIFVTPYLCFLYSGIVWITSFRCSSLMRTWIIHGKCWQNSYFN